MTHVYWFAGIVIALVWVWAFIHYFDESVP
jgi:hypothetical protein